jgi:hypothetical protein
MMTAGAEGLDGITVVTLKIHVMYQKSTIFEFKINLNLVTSVTKF